MLAQPPVDKSLWKLVSGQEPDQSAPNQVLASFSLQRDYGVKVGTVIHVPFFTPAQASAANSVTGTPPKPLGPTVALRVVGIVASEFDFPSGETPTYELFTTSAFAARGNPTDGHGHRVCRAIAPWCGRPCSIQR